MVRYDTILVMAVLLFWLFLLQPQALAAPSQTKTRFGGSASVLDTGLLEEFSFLGWGQACSAAVRHIQLPARGEGLGEPKEWRLGSLSIPPDSSKIKEDWSMDSSQNRFWDPSLARNTAAKLSRKHPQRGYTEIVRDAPLGPSPELAGLILTTAPFQTPPTRWPASPFALRRVHYHPLGNCALLVFHEAGAGRKARFKWNLVRVLNPGVRKQRAHAHATNGILLYTKSSELDGAMEELAIAARMDPYYPPARYYHALLLAAQGRLDEALPELKTAVKLDAKLAEEAKDSAEFELLRDDPRFLAIVDPNGK